jgi:hypothetical protein
MGLDLDLDLVVVVVIPVVDIHRDPHRVCIQIGANDRVALDLARAV